MGCSNIKSRPDCVAIPEELFADQESFQQPFPVEELRTSEDIDLPNRWPLLQNTFLNMH